jgi:uncharacterized protein with HEPN domain
MLSKDEAICLNMLEAVNKIQEISKDFSSCEDFAKDYIRFDATMMNFVVIGEMANKLSDSFKDEHQDIEWRRTADLRNIIAHDYFGIDDKEIWQIIKNKLPELKKYLEKVTGN